MKEVVTLTILGLLVMISVVMTGCASNPLPPSNPVRTPGPVLNVRPRPVVESTPIPGCFTPSGAPCVEDRFDVIPVNGGIQLVPTP